jgi:hypothetical protein
VSEWIENEVQKRILDLREHSKGASQFAFCAKLNQITKSRKVRWAEYVTCTEMRNKYTILVGESHEK